VTPEVSVVIPTRDRWHLLSARALPSALEQEGVDVEVVVVDDGSTDDTKEQLKGLAEPRVRTVRNVEPKGVAAARNAGIAAASGDWIAFFDDDDVWSPRKLSVQLDALRRSGASFAYCGVVALDEDGTPTALIEAPPVDDLVSSLLRRNTLPAGSSNVLVAKERLQHVGGFDEELSYIADWDLWLKLALSASAVACPEPLVGYVRHRGRMRLGGRAAVAELRRFEEKHASVGLRLDPSSFVGWIAGEHRRAGRRPQAIGAYLRAGLLYRDPAHFVRAGATVFDWRGAGLRRLLHLSRPSPGPEFVTPEWLRNR